MKQLNKSELLVGFIVGITTWFWIGPWAIVAAILTSLTWALGGAYGHAIRVYCVPIIMCGYVYVMHPAPWWIFLTAPFMMLTLSIGYGIESKDDKGSALGRFWFKQCKGNLFWTNFFTRGTIYLLLAITMIPWLWLK